MKVGYTLDFRNVTGRPWRDHWEDCLWLMTEAEAMGFDYLMVQEHFFMADGYGPSVPIFLATLAERTKRARIGSYTYVLPLHQPAQLAQETAVLDHLSGGRLDVCVGAGHRPLEFMAWNFSPRTRPSRMEEGLDILKLAWTKQPFSYKGKYYDLQNITVAPEPLQKPHPPLWVAATSPVAAERAGRHGANLHAASITPETYAGYLRGLAASGKKIEQMRVSNPWSITVTDEDPEKVWDRHKDLHFQRWDFYRAIRHEIGDPDLQKVTTGPAAYREAELIGSADVVLETLKNFRKTVPLTDIVHSGFSAGIPIKEEVYPSLKKFAEKVLPELKKW
jgi:alkanesulfonate monooxygenase SsuD/methylene tetrahydromethanopterin reductase-like flavin-dependent oxidoreductase (luciferase family)